MQESRLLRFLYLIKSSHYVMLFWSKLLITYRLWGQDIYCNNPMLLDYDEQDWHHSHLALLKVRTSIITAVASSLIATMVDMIPIMRQNPFILVKINPTTLRPFKESHKFYEHPKYPKGSIYRWLVELKLKLRKQSLQKKLCMGI